MWSQVTKNQFTLFDPLRPHFYNKQAKLMLSLAHIVGHNVVINCRHVIGSMCTSLLGQKNKHA